MTQNRSFDVVQHLAALRRFARTLTRDDTEADDLVHDALVRAYERRGSFDTRRGLKPWLFSVLHNTFIDRVRRRKAEAARDGDYGRDAVGTVAEPAQDAAVRLSQIRRAFDALPHDQREALHLVAVDGLPYQEAAAVLGVPVGTLMSRIGRARAALRALEADRAAEPSPRPNLKIVGGHDDPR
ncbi:sigma-70 family RNA polymerase sigma factor [Chthonobacter rhizosphaerae]|uniref:sigma-70 family RNA polymerase sigma factor n=1 Tax=Chthonobacter rhizosphaerae TaxID=2735553 RepID=UPI0015EF0146|nr:sigma-70 family RNA polymerase sigma factor [Chthonobacter rhizosphaerae]